MGVSGQYYRANRRSTRQEKRKKTQILFACTAVGILTLSAVITFCLGGWQVDEKPTYDKVDTGAAQKILAPLPMQGGGSMQSAQYAPAIDRTEITAYDASVIQHVASGQVSLDYFADAAFLGDSITVGFSDYDVNLGGALVCGYIGIGPSNVVNQSTQKHSERGEEVIIDVLAEHAPAKVYILLGSNTLVATGNDESFLGYYGAMLDMLYERLGEDTVLYVQSVPPVTAAAAAEKEGLASARLQAINEQLAHLAAEKGAVYLNLWDVLADEEGNLRAECAAPDGVHFGAGEGYPAWVNYLRTHTQYDANNAWTQGSTFAQ